MGQLHKLQGGAHFFTAIATHGAIPYFLRVGSQSCSRIIQCRMTSGFDSKAEGAEWIFKGRRPRSINFNAQVHLKS